MRIRDVEFYMTQELAYQEWLLTADALCEAYNELERLYKQKWDESREPPRKHSVPSVESVQEHLFTVLMC
jgi:hypothetical protein